MVAEVEELEELERGEKEEAAERRGVRQEERVVFVLREVRKEEQVEETSVGTAESAEDVDCGVVFVSV